MNLKQVEGRVLGFGFTRFTPQDKPDKTYISTWLTVAVEAKDGQGVDAFRVSVSDTSWAALGNPSPLRETLSQKNAVNKNCSLTCLYDNVQKKWILTTITIK